MTTDPRPHDLVVTYAGVDHAVVPGQPVTVCGLELPLLFSTNLPHGATCDDCFGGTP